MSSHIPFQERKTPWRGVLDLLTGCYPRFVFGGSTDGLLPVFHFHTVTPESLEPYLAYLAGNGYQTVTSDEIAAFVSHGTLPGPKCVALAFDDAWESLWTVAFPLLKKHGLTAIAYVSPGRVPEAIRARPTVADPGWRPLSGEEGFASWPEIKHLRASGTVDIQCHTLNHAVIFCDAAVSEFVTPAYRRPPHLHPLLNDPSGNRFVTSLDLGCPLYTHRSRMSGAVRYLEPVEARSRCTELVRRQGGAAFFARRDWQALLTVAAQTGTGRFETKEEQRAAILSELVQARQVLSSRLGGGSFRHMCFPFSVCGNLAQSLLAEAGYETAFADRLFGLRAVKPGHPPFRLMRLKHSYIFCLPGDGRQRFIAARRRKGGAAS